MQRERRIQTIGAEFKSFFSTLHFCVKMQHLKPENLILSKKDSDLISVSIAIGMPSPWAWRENLIRGRHIIPVVSLPPSISSRIFGLRSKAEVKPGVKNFFQPTTKVFFNNCRFSHHNLMMGEWVNISESRQTLFKSNTTSTPTHTMLEMTALQLKSPFRSKIMKIPVEQNKSTYSVGLKNLQSITTLREREMFITK